MVLQKLHFEGLWGTCPQDLTDNFQMMDVKHQKYSFEERKQQLLALYGLIPKKNTINTFIQSCFYDHFQNVYSNFSEEDRKRAYMNDFWGTEEEHAEKEREYYSKYPNPAPSSLANYGLGGI